MVKEKDKFIVSIVFIVAIIGLTTTIINKKDQNTSFGLKYFEVFSKKGYRI